MEPFIRKLLRTRDGRKFLVFVLLLFCFGYSVVTGAERFSSDGFSEYVKSFSNGFLTGEQVPLDGDFVFVKRVIDGDTIELESGEKVRYIGVNTPESVKANSPVECFGKESSAKNKELVEGKKVRLEKDVSDKDRYGRLLRFVSLEDGTFVNDMLVREGYARVSTFPPDVAKAESFKLAEREARENKRGLWADDTCAGKK